MKQVFDHILVDKLLVAAQMSQADVARALDISREAVSNWLSGDAVPRPRHRAMLAAVLGVSVTALSGEVAAANEPVVAYRVKKNRKVKAEKREWYKRDTAWLSSLEKRIRTEGLHRSFPHQSGSPTPDAARILAKEFRDMLGVDAAADMVGGRQLIAWMAQHGVSIIPAFWGGKQHPLNAMHVRLPDSDIHWMYVNLDASLIDMRFWLLHEIAHMMRRRPHDADGTEEQFADTFAAEVLFPMDQAWDVARMLRTRNPEDQADMITRLARARSISAVTVYRQVNAVLESQAEDMLTLNGLIYPGAQAFARKVPTLTDLLFCGETPSGVMFARICTRHFDTPVFRLAAEEIHEQDRGHGFVQRVFQCSTADAIALHEALREYGSEEDPS